MVHVECLSALAGCTTIGCREAPRPPRMRRALDALVACALDVAFALVLTAVVAGCLLVMTKEIVGSF